MIRLTFFILAASVLVSCSSISRKPSSDSNVESDLVVADSELKEIEDIQNMPSSNKDLAETEDIPIEINGLVVKWINWFKGKGRPHMEKYLTRSGRYVPLMKQILKDRGLPEDLVYISLIESGYSPAAHSRAGAVGYWQFMRGTGRDYGLKISSHIDERRDPILATQAAADYFSGLYNLFGSWYLAIASYNAGENKIKRLVMTYHTRDFWELIRKGRLPAETVNYVPKFIAASLIAKNPKKYGFDNIQYESPFEYDEVRVEGTISVRKLAHLMRVDYTTMRRLNPAYKTDFAMPARGVSFLLRVPKGTTESANRLVGEAGIRNARVILAAVAQKDDDSVVRYRVKRGDSLTGLANRFGVSVAQIAKTNRLSRRSMLRIGQTLVITKKAYKPSRVAHKKQSTKVAKKRKVASKKVHVVRRGETLSAIARKYRVHMRELADVNSIRRKSRVLVGDHIVIPD